MTVIQDESGRFFERAIDTNGNDKCPYCGSDDGFHIKFADVQIQFYDWRGVAIECNNDQPLFMRKARCNNCNKVIEKFLQ